ncbi:MAG: Pr6Pr family membrane protein, partial [Acholeplasmatales bacterium]|nr:Pr6Pr family membrane protein [Acholeplasmatales bacterium]
SLCLKALIVVTGILGVILTVTGKGALSGPEKFLYFTIHSNIYAIILAIVGLILSMIRIIKDIHLNSRVYYIFKFVGVISISLTGIVFCSILAPLNPNVAFTFEHILTHVVVPITCITDFLIDERNNKLKHVDLLYPPIFPVAYFIFASIAYACNVDFGGGVNYPYFFLNWGSPAGAFGFSKEAPFIGVVYWVIVLLIVILLLEILYIKLSWLLNKKKISDC